MTNPIPNASSPKPFELWIASLPTRKGSTLKSGRRPVLIVSAETYEALPYVSIIPLTRDLTTQQLPSHVLLCSPFLDAPSRALCEQVTTLDRDCLLRRIGRIEDVFDRFSLRRALAAHLSLEGTWDPCLSHSCSACKV